MRLSQLATTTAKNPPADAELTSHKLLIRAGYIKQQSAGIFSILPLGLRSLKKIEAILRTEMDRIGGQEILMPVVVTGDLWKESGRWNDVSEELLRFTDRNDKDMVLAMTHEEVITDIARRYLNSYRQLPVMLYQIQTKYRDEARPRGGLIRLREFTMKDGYSFHTTSSDLDSYYDQVYQAYLNIYKRCGLQTVVVQSDPGMMGGKIAHEFMVVTDGGEDTLVLCSNCNYAANREVAVSASSPVLQSEAQIELVQTPDCTTIDDLSQFLNIDSSLTAKAIACKDDQGTMYLVMIRGDLDVNYIKLQNHLGTELDNATDDDIESRGLVPGYMSPIGISERDDLKVIIDPSLQGANNVVCGANKFGYHYKGASFGRDFSGTVVDVAMVENGHTCCECQHELKTVRAIEVGNIFKLGTKYSESMSALFTDEDGKQKPMTMGCYGIGSARILASAAETMSDEWGMCLPITIAPYQVHLVALDLHKNDHVKETAKQIYDQLIDQGHDVLYDDRKESAGVKFKDADLLGVPVRITVSPRTLKQNGAEVKLRTNKDANTIELSHLMETIKTMIDDLYDELTP